MMRRRREWCVVGVCRWVHRLQCMLAEHVEGPCEVTVVNEVIRERPLEAVEAVSSGCAT